MKIRPIFPLRRCRTCRTAVSLLLTACATGIFCSSVSAQVVPRPGRVVQIEYPETHTGSWLQAVSINSRGEFYLTDTGLNRIIKTDSSGAILLEIGGFGWENEQFDQPLDIWAENALDVYVVDYNNNRIQRFDRNLNYVTSIVNDETRPAELQFAFPRALTVSLFGDVFVIETENGRVIKFDAEGRPLISFGDYDSGGGQLDMPYSICVAGEDDVFITDQRLQSVIRFDYYGNFLQEFGNEVLKSPGPAVIVAAKLAVFDEELERIFLFEKDGELIVDFALPPSEQRTQGAFDLTAAGNRLYLLDGSRRIVLSWTLQNLDH